MKEQCENCLHFAGTKKHRGVCQLKDKYMYDNATCEQWQNTISC